MAGPLDLEASELLRTAARAIHAERDRDRVAAWVVNALASVAHADVAALAVDATAHARHWTTAAGGQRDLKLLGDPRTLPELAAVLRGDAPGLVDDDHLRRLLNLGTVMVWAVPQAEGGVHGIALLGWVRDEPRSSHALTTVETLIAHLGVALDNREAMAALEAVQRGVVHKLQEAVRPPTPIVPQTELGVYYLAADRQASTGGDLYDWVLLPDGTLHLAVVDVMGKGVAATKDAVAVTHALRLLVLDGCPLERVVTRTDALVTAQNPELVVTLTVGRYNPATGVLLLAGGGHPPVLLVSNGEVRWIDSGGIPIGFPGAGSEGVVSIELSRSDTVIFYTDGLIESTKDIVKGLDALGRYAEETFGYPAASLARVLVERSLAGAVRNDDSLALVLRRRSPPEIPARLPLAPLEYRFTPTPAAVPLARHFLEDWLARVPVERSEAFDLLLVVTELATNAVRHASGLPGSVLLRASVHGADVMLEVEDDGGDPMPVPEQSNELPEALAERGRGLFLVRALVDHLESEVVDGRTLVRVMRRAVVAGPSQA